MLPIVGDTIELVFSGFQPIGPGYNGLYVCTVTGPSTVTYAVTTSPGATTVVGTAQWYSAIELSQMATTYFAQGNMMGVWVLELGYDFPKILSNNVTSFGKLVEC